MTADPVIARLDLEVDGSLSTQLIVVVGSEFVGTVQLIHQKRLSACIRQLFVMPFHRRRGIGRTLISEAILISLQSGCQTLGLSLASENLDAMAFYRRLGFILAYQYEDGSFVVSKCLTNQ